MQEIGDIFGAYFRTLLFRKYGLTRSFNDFSYLLFMKVILNSMKFIIINYLFGSQDLHCVFLMKNGQAFSITIFFYLMISHLFAGFFFDLSYLFSQCFLLNYW